MRYIQCIACMVFCALLVACSVGDEESGMQNDENLAANGEMVYEGVWCIDGSVCSTSTMTLNDTYFVLGTMPCGDLLRHIMPDNDVKGVTDDDYSASWDMVGYTEQALYYNIGKPSLVISATIDGVKCEVNVLIGQYNGFYVGASATYSKLSNVYKVAFPVSGCEVYDAVSEQLLWTSDKTAELSFVTTKRLK